MKVDAKAGHLDSAVARGERFLLAWERAGRPSASTLTAAVCAMAMVHDLIDDDPGRGQWLEVARCLIRDPSSLLGCASGYVPTFDAIAVLDRSRPDPAVERLACDIDDQSVWGNWSAALWRPWYAALWAEAAVLADHPHRAARLRRAVPATLRTRSRQRFCAVPPTWPMATGPR